MAHLSWIIRFLSNISFCCQLLFLKITGQQCLAIYGSQPGPLKQTCQKLLSSKISSVSFIITNLKEQTTLSIIYHVAIMDFIIEIDAHVNAHAPITLQYRHFFIKAFPLLVIEEFVPKLRPDSVDLCVIAIQRLLLSSRINLFLLLDHPNAKIQLD